MPKTLDWSIKGFSELDTAELYDIMQLRVDVFVVEQACIYRELDGMDLLQGTTHCQGRFESTLVAYARMMGVTLSDETVPAPPIKIGRVLVHERYRGQGVARQLMLQLLSHAHTSAPKRAIELSAQTSVIGFYESLGFTVVSNEYLEDGIPHIDMQRLAGDMPASAEH